MASPQSRIFPSCQCVMAWPSAEGPWRPCWKRSHHHQERLAPEDTCHSRHPSLKWGGGERMGAGDTHHYLPSPHSSYLWAASEPEMLGTDMIWQSLYTLKAKNIWEGIFFNAFNWKQDSLSKSFIWDKSTTQASTPVSVSKIESQLFFCLSF